MNFSLASVRYTCRELDSTKNLYQFIFIQNQFVTSASKRNIAGSSTHGKNTKCSYQPRGLEAFGRFEINANDFI